MKVKFTAEQKKYITVAELPMVKRIIADMKEDDQLQEYVQIAARIASRSNELFEILKTDAIIAKNCRAYDNYGEGSGTLDIWLKAYAFSSYKGFYNIGIYLTDVWNTNSENKEEIRSHMYIEEYTRK